MGNIVSDTKDIRQGIGDWSGPFGRFDFNPDFLKDFFSFFDVSKSRDKKTRNAFSVGQKDRT